jgi:hypothetical protein
MQFFGSSICSTPYMRISNTEMCHALWGKNTSAGAGRVSGNGEVTVKSHHLTITPHFEVFNQSVNNYEVNTKSTFDGQVLVILVSQDLWGQNTSTGLPRSKIFFGESRARNSSVLCSGRWFARGWVPQGCRFFRDSKKDWSWAHHDGSWKGGRGGIGRRITPPR